MLESVPWGEAVRSPSISFSPSGTKLSARSALHVQGKHACRVSIHLQLVSPHGAGPLGSSPGQWQ